MRDPREHGQRVGHVREDLVSAIAAGRAELADAAIDRPGDPAAVVGPLFQHREGDDPGRPSLNRDAADAVEGMPFEAPQVVGRQGLAVDLDRNDDGFLAVGVDVLGHRDEFREVRAVGRVEALRFAIENEVHGVPS